MELPRKTSKHLKAIFGQMLHRQQTVGKINPLAITRTDYDKARAKIFDIPIDYVTANSEYVGQYFPPHLVGSGKGRGFIQVSKNAPSGTATHELEHSLGYDMSFGEPFGPEEILFELSQKYPGFLEKLKQSVEPSLKTLIASDPEIASDWYTTKGSQATAEAARAMIRLFNHGPEGLRTDIAKALPMSHSMLQRVPQEISNLLTPYHQARGAADFASRMGY